MKGMDLLSKKIALFPGSFDPLTKGHVNLIYRGCTLFEELVVGIFRNTTKNPLFSMDERELLCKKVTRTLQNVSVHSFADSLTVDAVKQVGATHLLRGIRNASDYEYERDLARFNQELSEGFDTVFLFADPSLGHLSSSVLKEIHVSGGDVSAYLPDEVYRMLKNK
jgi:pantetheine-phosphate adenylyltransferase